MNSIQGDVLDLVKNFLAGGISGALAKTIIAPLQRVKLLLFIQSNYPNFSNQSYNGILDCLKQVYKEEGILAFWKGNQVYISRQFPLQAINFSLKDLLNRKLFNEKDTKFNKYFIYFSDSFLSGGIAGSIGLLIMYPDFSKINMVVNITQNKGLKGIYQGFSLACLGIFIYRSLYFGCYDLGKQIIYENHLNDTFLYKLLIAQTSVLLAETTSYPINTIRKRLLLQQNLEKPVKNIASLDENNNLKLQNQHKSFSSINKAMNCCFKIIQQEGIVSLFKGNFFALSTSIGSSLILVFYDEFQYVIGTN